MPVRTRSRNTRVPFHQGYEWHSGGSMSNDFGTWDGYGTIQTTQDFVTPGFHKLVADGAIVMSPFDSHSVILTGTPVSYKLSHSSGQFWYNDGNATFSVLNAGGVAPLSSGNSPIIEESTVERLRDEVSTAVLASVGRSDMNNWENLGQISQTMHELRSPLQNFRLWSDRFVSKAVYASKHGVWVRAPRGSRVKDGVVMHPLAPANLWLQYRYGLRLLIKDIEEVLKELNSHKPNQIVRTTTRKKRSISTSSSTSKSVLLGPGNWSFTTQVNEEVTVRAMSIEDVQISLALQLGLTGRQLLGVGWELIPYSFVVDWFANVGDFINAGLADPQLKTLGRCIVTKRTTQYTATCIPGGSNGDWSISGTPGSMTNTTVHTKRLVGLNNPSLVIRGDFQLDEVKRAADALALSLTAFDRAWGPKGILRNLPILGKSQ